MTDTLDREMATYTGRLPELRTHSGKYVLIHGDEVVGLYDTYADALTVGYEKFRLKPFLVKQIAAVEKANAPDGGYTLAY